MDQHSFRVSTQSNNNRLLLLTVTFYYAILTVVKKGLLHIHLDNRHLLVIPPHFLYHTQLKHDFKYQTFNYG